MQDSLHNNLEIRMLPDHSEERTRTSFMQLQSWWQSQRPKTIKLKNQIHYGSLEFLCFLTRLSPGLFYQERMLPCCIIVATCGNVFPQLGGLFNQEHTVLSIAYSYYTLMIHFFITSLYLILIRLHISSEKRIFHFLKIYIYISDFLYYLREIS